MSDARAEIHLQELNIKEITKTGNELVKDVQTKEKEIGIMRSAHDSTVATKNAAMANEVTLKDAALEEIKELKAVCTRYKNACREYIPTDSDLA